jgi:exonuclease III
MNKKAIAIASLNVKSLRNNSTKQKEIRAWVTSLAMPPQILLLQKHHLKEADCFTSTKGVEFWKGTFFWNHDISMG